MRRFCFVQNRQVVRMTFKMICLPELATPLVAEAQGLQGRVLICQRSG